MPVTFWSQGFSGIGHIRCGLPARALDDGSESLDFFEYIRHLPKGTTPQTAWEQFRNPSVWQLVCNWIRLHAMRDYRKVTGQPVYLEVDDNYLGDSQGYARHIVKDLRDLDQERNEWYMGPVPETGYPGVSSPVTHRIACEEADGILVSTDYLAEAYRKVNSNVHVCRNLVDPADWPEPAEKDGTFRVVFAGSPNAQDLVLIRRAMEWAARQPGVEAWVVGDRPNWRGVKQKNWFESVDDYKQFIAELSPDVMLRPIATTGFGQGKSDLKILEAAMMTALPVVSSAAPYLGWRGTAVRFAYDAKEWENQIRWCVKNQDQVRADAEEIRRIVLETRGLAAGKADWTRAVQCL